jgi:hypothetical protein
VQVFACASSPCQNGATCYDFPGNTFLCECQTGYAGNLCSVKINYCDPNPCNLGTCSSNRPGDYLCTCPAKYSGVNCEILLRVRSKSYRFLEIHLPSEKTSYTGCLRLEQKNTITGEPIVIYFCFINLVLFKRHALPTLV